MMKFKKIVWIIKSIFYKITFKKFGLLSYIGKPLILSGTRNVEIGNKVRILPGMRMEVINKNSNIKIADNVSIGQNFHIVSGGNLTIGANSTISANVLVTNLDHNYTKLNEHILKQDNIIKDTIIGENCFIGYGSVISPGTILGKQCIIAAKTVVKGKYPDYCVIAGVPGKVIKKYNELTGSWEKV